MKSVTCLTWLGRQEIIAGNSCELLVSFHTLTMVRRLLRRKKKTKRRWEMRHIDLSWKDEQKTRKEMQKCERYHDSRPLNLQDGIDSPSTIITCSCANHTESCGSAWQQFTRCYFGEVEKKKFFYWVPVSIPLLFSLFFLQISNDDFHMSLNHRVLSSPRWRGDISALLCVK